MVYRKHRHRRIPPIQQQPLPPSPPRETDLFAAEMNDDFSIDLHNMGIDEALRELDFFLDQECAKGTPAVKIIHGRGSQKMRAAVHTFLRRKTVYVEAFRDAITLPQQGGVTVAALYRLKPHF